MAFDVAVLAFAGVLLLYAAFWLFFETRPETGEIDPVKKRAAAVLFAADAAALAVLSAFELTGVFALYGAERLFTWAAGGVLVSFALLLLYKKRARAGANAVHTAFLPRLAIVLLILELGVFNFNAYKLMFKNYPLRDISFDSAALDGFSQNADGTITGSGSVTAEGLNIPVGTLTVEVLPGERAIIAFTADFSDETSSALRVGAVSGELISGYERSYTVPVNASGRVGTLRVNLTAPENETLTVLKISVNRPSGLRVSPVRALIIGLLCFGLRALLRSPRLKQSYEKEKTLTHIAAFYITAVLAIAGLLLAVLNSGGLKEDFTMTGGNQLTKELVDAFEKGQVSLLAKPNSELLSLENPYDPSQRADVSCLWDHLLYNGKYYSYYGVAPVVLVFLPYHLITGYYFPSVWAIFLFGAGGVVFLTLLYLRLMRKFHKDIPAYLLLAGLLIMQLSSGIWYCFAKRNFYEIAQSAGFFFVTAGAYFLIRANVIGEGRARLPSLCASSALLSLAVLSRPTTAVYCAAALAFIAFGFYKYRAERGGKRVRYLLCALLPYILFGGAQMLYNCARFGSPLDFGIAYSLTVNDFTRAEFHLHFVLIGFYNFLLALPRFIPRFPFFTSNVELFNPNGYYFVATNYAVGLLFSAPPVWALALSGKAYRKSASPYKKPYACLIGLVAAAAPAMIIVSTWESGYGIRYCVDFAWQIVICALCVLFTLYKSLKTDEARSLIGKAVVFALAASFAANFPQIWNWTVAGVGNQEVLARLKAFERLFNFWM